MIAGFDLPASRRSGTPWIAIGLCVVGLAAAAAETPLLLPAGEFPLAGVHGRIDHMAVDLGRQRLLVAELGNGTVDAVDLASGKTIRRIGGLKEPQGVGYAAKADVVAVASAGDGTVRLFRGADLRPLARIELGSDADNIRVDPRTGNFFVGYGDGGLAVIDPVAQARIGDINLPAHPEAFEIDAARNRAYVNIPEADQIAVVDLASGRQTANWRVHGLRANFPMALDEVTGELAIVFRAPPTLVILDARTGKPVSRLATYGDGDDVFFDAKRGRLYVSCGSGAVKVFGKSPAGWRPLSRVATRWGARTSLYVPAFDRLFVAARARSLGSAAAIFVFRPAP
jgi:hypothetical protein